MIEEGPTIAAELAWIEENFRRDAAKCRAKIDRLLPEAEAAGALEHVAWLYFYLGWLSIDGDDYDRALDILLRARNLFEKIGKEDAVARTANALGAIYELLGVFDFSLDHFRESIEIAERLGRKDIAGTACLNMAECLYDLGENEEALQAIHRCRTEFTIREISRSIVHLNAGKPLRALGRFREAEYELRQAVELSPDRPHDNLESRRYLSELLLDEGRMEEAGEEILTAIEAAEAAGERLMLAQLRLSRARLAQMQGHQDQALADAELVVKTARELGARPLEASAELAAYDSWQTCGECEKALAAFIRHTKIKDSMKGEATSRRIASLHSERSFREAKLFEGLYRQVSIVSDIGRRITANLDLDRILDDIYQAVNGIINAPTLLIGFLNAEEHRLDYRLVIQDGKRLEPFHSDLESGTHECQCVLGRQDILIGNFPVEFPGSPLTLKRGADLSRSLVIVPLLIRNRVEGVISIHSPRQGNYSKQEIETVRAIGAYVSVAVENARLFNQVQLLASTDGLTGLMNRRVVTEGITREFRKFKRYQTTASLIMVDIDHFKQVNDRFGHETGDRVIRAVARTLASMVRTCDFASRFGGEEFVMFLPETSLAGALVLAERLRVAIQALKVPTGAGSDISVTISLGVSEFHPADQTWEASFKRADTALYRSKTAGRNLVSAGE